MEIGLLTNTFSHTSIDEALRAVRAHGLRAVQLELASAGLAALPDQIPDEVAASIRQAAHTHGVDIAAVSGTFNMCHPDEDHRRQGLRRLDVLAGACAALGTNTITLCTGTRNRDSMWRPHPDNGSADAWRDLTATMQAAARIAAAHDVTLAFEPEVNNVVDSARKARQLLDEVGSPHLKVTIDPANLFHLGELPRMREIIEEAFALLSPDITLAHAKDLDHDGDAGHLPAGHGLLDYPLYLALLRQSGFDGALILHGLREADVDNCVTFLHGAIH
jgi:sugar phosphate isomerase/epimerase